MLTRFARHSSLRSFALTTAAVIALCSHLPWANAQNVPIPFASTVAGGGVVCANSISTYAPLAANQKLVGDGCPATQSTLNAAVGLAIDRFNNVAIIDQTNNLIRVIYNGGSAMAAAIVGANVQTTGLVPKKGYIYTIAGGPQSTPSQSTYYCSETGTGLIGLNKQLDGCPGVEGYVMGRGLAFDQDGNLFIANFGGSFTIRVLYVGGTAVSNLITLENPGLSTPPQPGYLYEIAGTGTSAVTTGDGGLAYKAALNNPRGLWIDSSENVYISETLSGLIRKVDGTTGLISTVVGYCASSTTCPTAASAGDGNPATSSAVHMNYPYDLAFDSFGNMFIADSGQGTGANGRIRVVYAGGTLPGISNPVVGDIYTYAGGGASSGTQAQQTNFQYVYGVGIDAKGYLYVNDYRNATSPGSNHMWRIDPITGSIANIAGSGGSAGPTAGAFCNTVNGPIAANTRGDGCPGPEAYMNAPQQAPVFDSYGNFYVAEHNGNVVRYFNYNAIFPPTAVGSSVTQTLAFSYPTATSPTATSFAIEGGTATDFTDAGGGTCSGSPATPKSNICTNNVTFTPTSANAREGTITISASSTPLVSQPIIGTGSTAQLTIDPGTITTLGTAIKPQGVSVDLLGNVYLSDGTGKQVLKTNLAGTTPVAMLTGLASPQGTTTDSFGNVYVADAVNNTVSQRASNGTVTTVVTGLSAPSGMTADILGSVYVADADNNRIVRYSAQTGVSNVVSVYPQTLSAPTGLLMDAAGDLYILDSGNKRIVELVIGALPQVLTLPAGVVPAAFALDHGGNLYVADTASATLMLITSTGTQTLQTGLVTPVGLAIDPLGDLFLADSSASSVQAFNRTLSTDVFATTNINQQSLPATLTLNSIGDLAATLSTPPWTETGNASEFPAATSGNTCTAGLVMTAGASCLDTFIFAPTTTGARAATLLFAPVSGFSVNAKLSGTAVNLILTSLVVSQAQPTTPTVSYGQSTTFLAKLTANTSGQPAPTGTITFVVDGRQQTPQTFASAGNSLTNSLTVGTHVIAAIYSGDSVYSGSNGSFSVTVGKAATAATAGSSQSVSGVTLTATIAPLYTGASGMTGTVTFYVDGLAQTPQTVGTGSVSQLVSVADGTHTVTAVYSGDGNYATSTSAPITVVVSRTATTTALTITPVAPRTTVFLNLVATVTGAGGTPSGTVTFFNGSTSLGTVALSGGSASLTIPTTTNYAFTATYSGDGLYQPSTVNITEGGDFAPLTPASALPVAQGGQAVATVSVVSVANYTGTMTAVCSNLPVNSLCRFSPVPLTVSPTANGNLGVQVYVGVSPAIAGFRLHARQGVIFAATTLLMFAALLGFRRRHSRWAASLLSIIALTVLAFGASGCGQTNAASTQDTTYTTPIGSYPITVTLTDTNNVSHAVIITVQVNSQ